jgi:hypothetical protein
MRSSSVAGEGTAFSLLFARQPIGVLALSYQLVDLLEADLTDDDGNVIGSFTVRDHLGIASFATRILPGTEGGINFKIFQQRATCRGQCTGGGVNGTTYLVDLGVISTPFPGLPLTLGAMVAHAGARLQFINAEQADPVATRLRVAGSYEVLHHFLDREDVELWTTAEVEDRLQELGSTVLYMSAEFVVGEGDQIFVRSGYAQGQEGQLSGASVGLGLRYQQFEIGIGRSLSQLPISGGSEPVQVTFAVLF